MGMNIGIIGLPNVGKSTLFNAITNNEALTANYPFATIKPNTGVVSLPDNKLNKVAEIFNSKQIVPALVNFVDIAGIVKGASKGSGLGNQFLVNIRECNAICHVVRAFSDSNILHIENKVDPESDIKTIESELIFADLQILEKILIKVKKNNAKSFSDSFIKKILTAQDLLYKSKSLFSNNKDFALLKELNLLTTKPILYVFNCDELILTNLSKLEKLYRLVAPAKAIFMDIKLEMELQSLDFKSANEIFKSIGQNGSNLNALIQAGFHTLNLQTYLTAGPKESKAWIINQGDSALQAAKVIHTDIARGFIRAEIVSFEDLIRFGSMSKARASGKVRMEGKEYVIDNKDIVNFHFNT